MGEDYDQALHIFCNNCVQCVAILMVLLIIINFVRYSVLWKQSSGVISFILLVLYYLFTLVTVCLRLCVSIYLPLPLCVVCVCFLLMHLCWSHSSLDTTVELPKIHYTECSLKYGCPAKILINLMWNSTYTAQKKMEEVVSWQLLNCNLILMNCYCIFSWTIHKPEYMHWYM